MKTLASGTQKGAKKMPFKFSWKTPERRNGESPLPIIANEIYLAIFDQFEVTDDMDPAQRAEYRTILSNLALVCRFFCAACLPRVFRVMEYSGQVHGESTPSYAKFCRELNAGDETACYLAQHVKECTISHWMQAVEKGQWVFGNFLKVYIKSITSLVNLEALRLHRVPIDLKFLEALGALEKLKLLSVSSCDFQPLTKDNKWVTGSLKVAHFELWAHRNDALLAPLSQIICSNFLRTLRTDNWGFSKAVMSQSVSFNIEALTIPIAISEVMHVRSFLNRNPNITDLSIFGPISILPYQLSYPILDLDPSSIPQLSRLECSPCFLDGLVPGRPLKLIKINWTPDDILPSLEDVEKMLSAIRKSTAPLTVLRVPADVYVAAPFHRIFPQLEILILDVPVYDAESINTICTKWPHSPSVISLQFHSWHVPMWRYDLPLQLSMVSEITSAFPTVLYMRITDEVEWRRHHDQDHEWRPFVLGEWKQGLKTVLKHRLSTISYPGRVKDHGGCFAALFRASNDGIYLRYLGAT